MTAPGATACYIDHRNEKARYLDAFWRLASWDFAARQLDTGGDEARKRVDEAMAA